MTTTSRTRTAIAILSGIVLAGMTGAAWSEEPTPVEMVDGLNAVFGKYPHTRAGHATGFCVSGSFTPAPEALCDQGVPIRQDGAAARPLLARRRQPASARQCQVQCEGARGQNRSRRRQIGRLRADLGPGLRRQDAGSLFLELLQAIASGDPEKPKAFFAAHPESTNQGAWLNARPVPASYAGVNYFGVHAFTLTNATGEQQIVKFKAVPKAGEENLTDAEAEAKGPNFLDAELKERLGKGSVAFDVVAVHGKDGDPLDDPTHIWEEEGRTSTPLGTITIEALAPDEKCDAIMFLPNNLADGIADPANDLIFTTRSADYVVSFSRRAAP